MIGNVPQDPRTTKRFLEALRGRTQAPPPFWFMRQAGRYLPEYRALREGAAGFLDFCYSPDLAVEATLQPLRRFAPDAAILFSDILVIPDALGQPVTFREGEGPLLEALNGGPDLGRLDPGRVLDHLNPVFETVRRLAGALPDGTALIGFAGSPWTVATYMVEGRGGTDFAKVRAWAEREPDGFGHLVDLLVEATAAYLVEQVRHGAEALQLFDTWSGMLEGEGFHRWVIEPTRRIVERVRASEPDVPILGFPRGAGAAYETYAAGTGVDGLSLDPGVDLAFARDVLQKRTVVQGNLDPQVVAGGGAEQEIAAAQILDVLGHGPFVFNLGHGIVPETPVENVVRLAEIVRAWQPDRAEAP